MESVSPESVMVIEDEEEDVEKEYLDLQLWEDELDDLKM